MMARRRRVQPRDVRGRYGQLPKPSGPPLWFIVAFVALVFVVVYAP